VLRRIFRPKGDEEKGDWRKFHDVELHNLHASASIIRVIKSKRMKSARNVARMGEMRNDYEIFSGSPQGMRSLRKHKRRWEDNIKIDHKEIWCVSIDWIHLGLDED
jgi:hypothetical protein